MKTKQERYPSCVYSTLSGCLPLQGSFLLNLKTVHFQIFFFFLRGAILMVGFSSKHTVFSLCLMVRQHV